MSAPQPRPSRRDILKPVQLVGLALAAAVFAAGVTLVAMGFFQQGDPIERATALQTGGIVGGVTFIVVLVLVALMLLAINPADMQKPIDRPVLYGDDEPRGRG